MPRRKRRDGTRAPNHASTIYLGTDGRWHGRVTVGIRDDGRPDRRHIERRTEADVITAVRKLEAARASGRVRKPGRGWTVQQWLTHWLDNIISLSVRPKTAARYRTDVTEYLIPGLGAHRLETLEPEHLETLYARLRDRTPALAPSTIYHVHATLRTSLNEAVRRRHITDNPARIARAPQLVEAEIEPLTVAEAQRILDAARTRPNGVRFAFALSLGLRQGEALGLKWSDYNPTARTLAIRRSLQRHTWRHGCDNPHRCAAPWHKTAPCTPGCRSHRRACPAPCPPDCAGHARHCPARRAGGLVEAEVKSRAGRRVISVPDELAAWLDQHLAEQHELQQRAADLWEHENWIFTQPTGKPLDPRADYQAWRHLLDTAQVRPARLHDARHTAATMLLVLKVPVRAAMDIMGWSEASMATRYMHVPDEFKHDIADQLAQLLWPSPHPPPNGADRPGAGDAPVPLTEDQRAGVRLIASALPDYWRHRINQLLDDTGDGDTGNTLPIPA